eukprot:1157271-Pelagomonas_calceolata.AAC.13
MEEVLQAFDKVLLRDALQLSTHVVMQCSRLKNDGCHEHTAWSEIMRFSFINKRWIKSTMTQLSAINGCIRIRSHREQYLGIWRPGAQGQTTPFGCRRMTPCLPPWLHSPGQSRQKESGAHWPQHGKGLT